MPEEKRGTGTQCLQAPSRNHYPQDLPIDQLTHVLYAFARVSDMDGQVTLSNRYTDIEKHYPTDAVNDPQQKDMYGTIKQIMKLKSSNRHLKALLSIGGWGTALNFTGATSTESNRKNFARTALELVKDLGFDGLDIDWEVC